MSGIINGHGEKRHPSQNAGIGEYKQIIIAEARYPYEDKNTHGSRY
jgi:hypothetical protein